MDDTIRRFGATFTLDTNVIIRACDDNAFAEKTRLCLGSDASEIIINSQAVSELERHGLSMKIIPTILESRLRVKNVTYDAVSESERKGATILEQKHKTLHRGDSSILAFAHARGLVLMTCDNGLVKAARDTGVKCINPNTKGRGVRK